MHPDLKAGSRQIAQLVQSFVLRLFGGSGGSETLDLNPKIICSRFKSAQQRVVFLLWNLCVFKYMELKGQPERSVATQKNQSLGEECPTFLSFWRGKWKKKEGDWRPHFPQLPTTGVTGSSSQTHKLTLARFFLLVHSLETTACQSLKRDETSTDGKVDGKERNGCMKGKGRKRHRRARR